MNAHLVWAGGAVGRAVRSLHVIRRVVTLSLFREPKAMAHTPGAYPVHKAILLAIVVAKLHLSFEALASAHYFVNVHFMCLGPLGCMVGPFARIRRVVTLSLFRELKAMAPVLAYRVHNATGVSIAAVKLHLRLLVMLAAYPENMQLL